MAARDGRRRPQRLWKTSQWAAARPGRSLRLAPLVPQDRTRAQRDGPRSCSTRSCLTRCWLVRFLMVGPARAGTQARAGRECAAGGKRAVPDRLSGSGGANLAVRSGRRDPAGPPDAHCCRPGVNRPDPWHARHQKRDIKHETSNEYELQTNTRHQTNTRRQHPATVAGTGTGDSRNRSEAAADRKPAGTTAVGTLPAPAPANSSPTGRKAPQRRVLFTSRGFSWREICAPTWPRQTGASSQPP